jgi:hypothetical protein
VSGVTPRLIVNADAVFALAITLQRFEAVSGRSPEIVQSSGVIEGVERSPGDRPEIVTTGFPRGLGASAVEDIFGSGTGE